MESGTSILRLKEGGMLIRNLDILKRVHRLSSDRGKCIKALFHNMYFNLRAVNNNY